MSAESAETKPASPLQSVLRWVKERTSSPAHDLAACGDREVEQIAKDIGVSPAELYQLARSDAAGNELLLQRMAALDLDCKEVARLMPETMHDLQRLCTLCKARRHCAHDLAQHPDDPNWKDYCPNVATLLALDAMPWAARSEW
jgi:hypothetical protein